MGQTDGVKGKELIARVPRRLPVSKLRPGLHYELADDLIATRSDQPSTAPTPLMQSDEITVQPVSHVLRTGLGNATVAPVYRRTPGGGLAVPTGRVLVRFAAGESADERREDLANAGYVIDEVLRYAPHAAWVRARSGDIADTLTQIGHLLELGRVENVEPQMVSEVSRRA